MLNWLQMSNNSTRVKMMQNNKHQDLNSNDVVAFSSMQMLGI